MSIQPITINDIHKKYYAHGCISELDYNNILLLHDDLDNKNQSEVMKLENARFNKIGFKTKTSKLLHELVELKKGLKEYVESFKEKKTPSNYVYEFDLKRYYKEMDKALFATLYIDYIDKMIKAVKKDKASFGLILDDPEKYEAIVSWLVKVALNYNIILNFMTYNKEYYDQVLADAEMLRIQQEERDSDYMDKNPYHINGTQRVSKAE